MFFTQGFWAVFRYRISLFVFARAKWPPFRVLLLEISLIWQKGIEICTGVSIPASIKIEHSFYIDHFDGIIINAKANNANNCNISQGVINGISFAFRFFFLIKYNFRLILKAPAYMKMPILVLGYSNLEKIKSLLNYN